MYRIILSLIIFLSVFTVSSYADETVIFKYLGEDGYSAYISTHNEFHKDHSVRGTIARKLLHGFFSVDRIPKKYYKVVKTEGIEYFGFKVTQYVAEPLDKSRFKHVIWLDEKEHIVKVEVYDNHNVMMFSFSGFDFLNGAVQSKGRGKGPGGRGKERCENPEDCPKDLRFGKYKFWDAPEFYNGFRHFHTTVLEDNSLDLVFEDGLNKISVFIKDVNRNKAETVSTIVYGNYLYNRTIDGIEYTIYGTVPYGVMEDLINILSENLDMIMTVASAGNVLTKDIYSNSGRTTKK